MITNIESICRVRSGRMIAGIFLAAACLAPSAKALPLYWNGGATIDPPGPPPATYFNWTGTTGGWLRPPLPPGTSTIWNFPVGQPHVAYFDASVNSGPFVNVGGTVQAEALFFLGSWNVQGGVIDVRTGQIILGGGTLYGDSFADGTVGMTSTLSGSNGLTVSGGYRAPSPGVLNFSGSAAYTGDTTLGGVTMSFSGYSASSGNRINAAGALTLSQATAAFDNYGSVSAASQSISNVLINGAGVSRLQVVADSANMSVDAGAIYQGPSGAGAILHLLVTEVSDGTASIITSNSNSNGILGGRYLFGSSTGYDAALARDWASAGAGGVVEAASYVSDDFGNAANNVNLTESASLSADTEVNSLRIDSAESADLTISAGRTLTLQSGGILAVNSAGAGVAISGGSVTSDAAALFLHNQGEDVLEIGSAITGNIDLIVSGGFSAPVILSGNNSFMGNSYVDGASVTVAAGSGLGAGNLTISGAGALSMGESDTISGLTVSANSSLDIAAGKVLTVGGGMSSSFDGVLFGEGTLRKVGTGQLSFSTASSVAVSRLEVAGGSVSTASSVMAGSTQIQSGGTLIINAPVDPGSEILLDGGVLYTQEGVVLENVIWNSGTMRGSGLVSGNYVVDSGKVIAPGNSPGTTPFEGQAWSGGGEYEWEINSLSGIAGGGAEAIGWDLVTINQGDEGTRILDIDADAGNRFTISIVGLTISNEQGALTGWDNTILYSWLIASAEDGIENFTPDAFQFDASAFSAYNSLGGGSFSVSLANGDTELWLNFTPVPEPSTWVLIVLSAAVLVRTARRSRRSCPPH